MAANGNGNKTNLFSEQQQNILKKRAKKLAEISQEDRFIERDQFILFQLYGDNQYGVDYQAVAGILHNVKVSWVPDMPIYVAGLFGWRGEILTMVDLGRFLNLAAESAKPDFWTIVVHREEAKIGFKVSKIVSNELYDKNAIQNVKLLDVGQDVGYVKGLLNNRIIMLEISVLLSAIFDKINQHIDKRWA